MMNQNDQINSEYPYNVSGRCNNREWFGVEMDLVWEIMCNYLYFIRIAYEVRIISFVLMNNHFHLIIAAPKNNLSEAMNYFMRETSKRIGEASGKINHIYGSRFHRTLIHNDHYFQHAYKYNYRNPVEAGLSKSVEEYRYSSLRILLGFEHSILPLEEDRFLFDSGVESTLQWMNQKPSDNDRKAVRSALKKKIYQLPHSRRRNKPHHLETSPY